MIRVADGLQLDTRVLPRTSFIACFEKAITIELDFLDFDTENPLSCYFWEPKCTI